MDGPWKVYFELNGKTNDDTLEFLQKYVDTKSLWYIHPSGKRGKGPHCHGLIWNHAQTAETFRNKIKSAFNLVKQGSFGISNTYERGTKMSEETVSVYINYMSKGIHDPLLNIGYDNDYVNERKREWKEPTAVHISGDLTVITHGDVKKVRITQVTIARMACEQYNEKITLMNAKRMLDTPDRAVMYNIVKKLLKENQMSCNYRQMSNIIQDMLCTLDPGAHMAKVLSMV